MRGSVTHVFRATRELTEPEGKRQRSSQLDDKLSSYQKFFGQIPSEGYQKASGKPTHPLGPTLAATTFCFLKPAYLVIKLPQSGRGVGWNVQVEAQSYQIRLKQPPNARGVPDTLFSQGPGMVARSTNAPSHLPSVSPQVSFPKLASFSRRLPESGRGNGLAGSS